MDRLYALLVTLLLCGAVLSPAIPDAEGRHEDGFPLSWFPMFRGERPAIEKVTYVYATTPDGARHKLSTRWWTSGGISEGRAHLRTTLGDGSAATAAFCARLAEKLAKKGRGWQAEAVAVHIARGTFSADRYFRADDRTPLTEKIVASCDVP